MVFGLGEFPLLLFGVTAHSGCSRHYSLQWDMAEQVRHRLAVVSSTDGLCEDHGDVNNLEEERQRGKDVVNLTRQEDLFTVRNIMTGMCFYTEKPVATLRITEVEDES